jgi:hypothetical protein
LYAFQCSPIAHSLEAGLETNMNDHMLQVLPEARSKQTMLQLAAGFRMSEFGRMPFNFRICEACTKRQKQAPKLVKAATPETQNHAIHEIRWPPKMHLGFIHPETRVR